LWQVVEEMRNSDSYVEYELPTIEKFDAEAFTEKLQNFFKPKHDTND
jgi:hypothetical protein